MKFKQVRAAGERKDGVNYPPLPDEFTDSNGIEHVLNIDFIKKCSRETYRLLLRRYGSEQINGLLQIA